MELSQDKDSFPGMYDTSSAGHIPAGKEPMESALRELEEELGVKASADDLSYAGKFHAQYTMEFHTPDDLDGFSGELNEAVKMIARV